MTGRKQKRQNWLWKEKNSAPGGLLYNPGNWGDMLKMLWIREIVRWKQQTGAATNYTDPFAGDVAYPLGTKQAFRLAQLRRRERCLDFLQEPFLDRTLWPSAASGAMLLVKGSVKIWDADEGRRTAWRNAGSHVAESIESGWELVGKAPPDPAGLLLVDPYDFLAEWEEFLPLLVEKSNATTTLLYLYNRSGKKKEVFADYRRFRGRLDDCAGNRPKRVGRIAADGFLPDAWHETVFLPCAEDAERPGFAALLDRLEEGVCALHEAQVRSSVFDC